MITGVIIVPMPYSHSCGNQPMTWWLWLIVGITITMLIGFCIWISLEIKNDQHEDRTKR